jgi:DNA-directed RNA polymerase subunit RPC12/RpoP
MPEGERVTHDTDDRVLACPECDKAGDIYERRGSNAQGDERFRCGQCSHRFEDPTDREARHWREGEPDSKHDDGIPTGLSPEMKAKVRELREASD